MLEKSSLCFGKIHHVRKKPREHRFSYSMFMPLLNLDDLPAVKNISPLLGLNRRGIYSFHEADYLAEHLRAGETLKQRAIRVFRTMQLEQHAGFDKLDASRIQVLILAQWRCLGRVFNPITILYFLVDKQLVFILSEVSNTPWKEKHIYGQSLALSGARESWQSAKQLHVSPFNGMDMQYHWTSEMSEDHVSLKLALSEKNVGIFDASFQYKRLPFTSGRFHLGILQQPFLSFHAVLGIYWQALRLALKRLPFHQHPKYMQQEKNSG